MSDASHPNVHKAAQAEVRRIMQELVQQMEPGEHLGTPRREDGAIVIPLVEAASPRPAQDADESLRALLAAWLDRPVPQ